MKKTDSDAIKIPSLPLCYCFYLYLWLFLKVGQTGPNWAKDPNWNRFWLAQYCMWYPLYQVRSTPDFFYFFFLSLVFWFFRTKRRSLTLLIRRLYLWALFSFSVSLTKEKEWVLLILTCDTETLLKLFYFLNALWGCHCHFPPQAFSKQTFLFVNKYLKKKIP